jgi:hypothetical protein
MQLNDLPAVGQPLEGGLFAGLTTTKDGQHCAVVLLDDKPKKLLSWSAAMKWAEKLKATLPTRPVAALLFAKFGDQFDKEWHWTGDELDGSYAGGQHFLNGHQYTGHKSYEGRARAVRLIHLTA